MSVVSGIARGTIIKVPDSSPGLVMINGQQKPFVLEGRWRSPVAPALNMTVDVDLDDAGAIAAIAVVDSQQLAKEKLDHLGALAEQHGKEAAALARQGVGTLTARMGTASLTAGVLIWIAWFFMPAIRIDVFVLSRSFTFWQVLGIDLTNPTNPIAGGHGFLSFVGLLAIAAPFAAPFLARDRARYLNAAPLGYLALSPLLIYWHVGRAAGNFGDSAFRELARGMAREAASTAWQSTSLAAGGYVLVGAAIVLAARAVKR